MNTRSIASVALLAAVVGCHADYPGGGFGATQGGVQDMRFARDLVERGQVPPPEAFVVEGMFSEHDLPLDGPDCARTLCLRAAAGTAPTLDGAQAGWVQLGMSSTIDPATWRRPSVSIVAVVDVSGSMAWGDSDAAPGELARALLRRIVAELDGADRVAVVTYGDTVETRLGFVPGDDRAPIDAVVEGLGEAGSTDMEGGLTQGYALARQAQGTDEVRVMLFTDVQPNVGATDETTFEAMARAGADDGVGLTVFALGLGVGQELLLAMSRLRLGNAFGLTKPTDVDALMDESFPYLLAPIAEDLRLTVTTNDGAGVARAYGFPSGVDDDGAAQQQEQEPALSVATVFLSKKRGALLLQLDASPFAGAIALTYRERGGDRVEASLPFAHDGDGLAADGRAFQQRSVGRAVALAMLVEAMKEAATRYAVDPVAAADHLLAARERFAADIRAEADPALDAELAFTDALLALVQDRAPQGDLYGQSW